MILEELKAELRPLIDGAEALTAEELRPFNAEELATFVCAQDSRSPRLACAIKQGKVSGGALARLLFATPQHMHVEEPAEIRAFAAPTDVEAVRKLKEDLTAKEDGGGDVAEPVKQLKAASSSSIATAPSSLTSRSTTCLSSSRPAASSSPEAVRSDARRGRQPAQLWRLWRPDAPSDGALPRNEAAAK